MSKNLNDSLGDRMKLYEEVTNFKLPIKSYILGRIDGNAFKTYTRGLERPFDNGLIDDMNSTAIYLCENIQNCKFAYVQSDEISVFVHEEGINTQPWFSNKLAKMNSIGASKATTEFNRHRLLRKCLNSEGILDHDDLSQFTMAEFDARFWTVPSAIEVYNYFLWRQRDAEKNSISAAAQAVYSHKDLEGKNGLDKQEMLLKKGINWEDYTSGQKRGRFIEKHIYVNDQLASIFVDNDNIKTYVLVNEDPKSIKKIEENDKVRSVWEVTECPIFSQNKNFLFSKIKISDLDIFGFDSKY